MTQGGATARAGGIEQPGVESDVLHDFLLALDVSTPDIPDRATSTSRTGWRVAQRAHWIQRPVPRPNMNVA
ncbi:hypothetical protein [Alloactinosynnema sp. L-07]|nr:hypothetical protein [Alloactinosynnema sp. L-07]